MCKFFKKYTWPVFIGAVSILTFFKVLPSDWGEAVNFIAKVDAWIIETAAYPGLFIIFFALFLGTVVVPWLRGIINQHRAIENLWKLRRKGVSHRNDHSKVTTEYDYTKWKQEFDQWFLDAKAEAKKVSVHLCQWLDTLNLMETGKMPPFQSSYDNNEFRRHYAIMSEALNRIERYLVRELILRE